MNKYKYKNPLDEEYKQFRLNKKQHNKILKYRKLKWRDKCEYYYNDRGILIHKFTNRRTIILCMILFPLIIIADGLYNFKETINDYKKIFDQKKHGNFIADFIRSNNKEYKEIMNIIKK